jgi:hypothetical protein
MTLKTQAEARPHLEVELKRIKEEIAGYPGPIAGCDAQFNHLLEERQRLLDALRDMDNGA